MLKNYLFSPLCSAPFLYSIPLFLFLSTPHLSSFFSVSVSAPLFFFLLQPFFSFQFMCALFFSPKTFFSTQNNSLFSPKTFFSVQTFFSPKVFQFFFSPNVFCFSLATILFFFFSALFFSGSALFFLFQRFLFFLFFSSVYPRPNILSSSFTSLLFE